MDCCWVQSDLFLETAQLTISILLAQRQKEGTNDALVVEQ